MKYSFFILSIIVCLLSCEPVDNGIIKRVDVVLDVTEDLYESKLDPEIICNDVIKILNIDKHYAGKASVHLYTLDDISGSRANAVSLPQDHKGNSLLRKKAIDEFQAKIREEVVELLKFKGDKDQSKIYAKFCRILNTDFSNERHVLFYSDLMENSELANFYNSKSLAEAASTPDSFTQKYFNVNCKIENLKSVNIYIFPIRTPQNDKLVNKAELFWSGLLEKKGAKVNNNEIGNY